MSPAGAGGEMQKRFHTRVLWYYTSTNYYGSSVNGLCRAYDTVSEDTGIGLDGRLRSVTCGIIITHGMMEAWKHGRIAICSVTMHACSNGKYGLFFFS